MSKQSKVAELVQSSKRLKSAADVVLLRTKALKELKTVGGANMPGAWDRAEKAVDVVEEEIATLHRVIEELSIPEQ
jgi:hypothetical protein